MTVYEHAMIGINGTLALGLQRRHGWQIVALAGLAAVLPDLDGLTILLGPSLYADGHWLWGHNLLVAGLVAVIVSVAIEWTEFHEQVERLPGSEREVFGLIYYDGLTQTEVGKVLGLSLTLLNDDGKPPACGSRKRTMENGLSKDDEDLLADLLVQWKDTWDAGQEVSAEELCADTPHLVEPLKQRIGVLKEMAWLKKDPARPMTDDLSAKSEPLTGILQDRYRLDAHIGQGGYGQVYRAFDLQLHRPVAVKIAYARTSTDLLMDEARRVARLRHPGIVTVHDVGEHKGRLFLVFDLVEGPSLATVCQKRRLSVKEAVDLVAQVATTLHYAHERNCIHRDIKPENILIDADGRPLVADFGVAISLDELARGQSLSQGTLPYMAPEQVAGEVQMIDRRADIYALGVVLYELLTGRLPFEAVDTATLREEILFRSPKPLRNINSSIPVGLEAICQKCMARHPSDRFATAEELAVDLRSIPSIPWWHWRFWLAVKQFAC